MSARIHNTLLLAVSLSILDPVCPPVTAQETTIGKARIAEISVQLLRDAAQDEVLVLSNVDTVDITDQDKAIQVPAVRLPERWQHGHLPYTAEVAAVAAAHMIDPALIHAVIAAESSYDPQALSASGAHGLMQVLPATARMLSTTPVRRWSVQQQITGGTLYLKRMLDLFEGDVALALAAYNAGPQAVKNHHGTIPPFSETQRYVPRVLGYYQAFRQQLARQPLPGGQTTD